MTTDPASRALMDYLESFSGYPEEPVWHEDGSITGVTFDGVPYAVKTIEEWDNTFSLRGYGIPYFGTLEVKKKLIELMSRLPGANQPSDKHPQTGEPLFKNAGAYMGFMLPWAEKIWDKRANPPGLDPEEYPNREEHEECVKRGNTYVMENGEYLTKAVATEVVQWRSRDNGDKSSPKPAPRASASPRPGPTAQTPLGAKPQAPTAKPSDPEKGKTMEELSPEALRVIQENTAASNRLAAALEKQGPEFLTAMDKLLRLVNEANEGNKSAPADEPVATPEAPAKSQSELDIYELVRLIKANPALQQALHTKALPVEDLKGALKYLLFSSQPATEFTKDLGRISAALDSLYTRATGIVHATVLKSANPDPDQLLEEATDALNWAGYPPYILGLASDDRSLLANIASNAFLTKES